MAARRGPEVIIIFFNEALSTLLRNVMMVGGPWGRERWEKSTVLVVNCLSLENALPQIFFGRIGSWLFMIKIEFQFNHDWRDESSEAQLASQPSKWGLYMHTCHIQKDVVWVCLSCFAGCWCACCCTGHKPHSWRTSWRGAKEGTGIAEPALATRKCIMNHNSIVTLCLQTLNFGVTS